MTNDERKKIYQLLSAPFPEEAIERTEGRVTGRGYNTTGLNGDMKKTGAIGIASDLPPTVAIEIADECSGIRSSLALVMTVLLAGHMFLTSAWKKALLALAVIPLTIVKNGIRIVSLTLLAVHVNPSFLTGQLHHEGGIVFFVLALLPR